MRVKITLFILRMEGEVARKEEERGLKEGEGGTLYISYGW